MFSPLKRFTIEFGARTILGVLWPKRMEKDRRRKRSPKGILRETLIHAGVPYVLGLMTQHTQDPPECAIRVPAESR